MSEYKQTKGPKGRFLYFKDGKMISKAAVPAEILDTLQLQKPVDDTKPEFRKCIFCGDRGTEQKLINLQSVDLCFEHYHNKTTGEIVQHLREQGATNGQNDSPEGEDKD